MLEVNRRGGFSDRNVIKPINTDIQLKELDMRTRNRLFNLVVFMCDDIFRDKENSLKIIDNKRKFINYLIDNVYSSYIMKYRPNEIEEELNFILQSTILNDSYDSVLTLVEATAQYMQQFGYNDVYSKFNELFELEYVGYRFIGDIISPISNEFEVTEIGHCLNQQFQSVHEHILKANRYLSDRNKPDYENSIKESISAIEAICKEILQCDRNQATLGNMLKKLENEGIYIHNALKGAFEKMYGYTSDANGIRHAGDIGGPSSTFEEARFMLVACSAFINYLIGVSTKSKKVVI